MFRLDVLQNQWLVLALAGGLVLVLCVALYYLALWRPRPGVNAQPTPKQPVLNWLLSFLPALLVLTYISVLVFAVVYTLAMARHPPNW